jgi:DNA-binding MarR family transcriptional regulator
MENPAITHKRFIEAVIPMMHFFHNLAGSMSRGTDFSLAQYRVLMLVNHRGPMTINALRINLNVAQSTASEMVERLVQVKMLVREKSPTDRRVTIFKLTPKAEKMIADQLKNSGEGFKKVLDPFTESEKEEFIQAVETIHRLIQRHVQTQTANLTH